MYNNAYKDISPLPPTCMDKVMKEWVLVTFILHQLVYLIWHTLVENEQASLLGVQKITEYSVRPAKKRLKFQ